MDHNVCFPDESPQWEPDRDSLTFYAIVGTQQFKVLVKADLLLERFHAPGTAPEALERVFRQFREELHDLARTHILAGHTTPNNELLLSACDYRFKKVTFEYKIKQARSLFHLVRIATHRLEQIVAPSSRRDIEVEWDRAEDDQGRAVAVLRLSDSADAVTGLFTPTELESDSVTRFRLHRVWGDLLQIRSNRQLQTLQQREAPVEV